MSVLDSASSIGGDVATFIGNNMGRNAIGDLAGQASNATNPLTQPQRQPFQQALNAMLFGPNGAQNFMQTDPFIQAQTRSIGDWAKANFASSGNMPLTAITGSSQLASVQGQEFNQRIQDLLMGGGYTMNNNYGGQGYTAAINPTMNSYQSGAAAGGNLFGQFLGMAGGFPGMPGGGSMIGMGPG